MAASEAPRHPNEIGRSRFILVEHAGRPYEMLVGGQHLSVYQKDLHVRADPREHGHEALF